MSIQFDDVNFDAQREKLARMTKDARSQTGMNRPEFEVLHNLPKDFMARVEHGDTPTTARRALHHMISELGLPTREKNMALSILEELCPRRQERRKVHLRIGILQSRRGLR